MFFKVQPYFMRIYNVEERYLRISNNLGIIMYVLLEFIECILVKLFRLSE